MQGRHLGASVGGGGRGECRTRTFVAGDVGTTGAGAAYGRSAGGAGASNTTPGRPTVGPAEVGCSAMESFAGAAAPVASNPGIHPDQQKAGTVKTRHSTALGSKPRKFL